LWYCPPPWILDVFLNQNPAPNDVWSHNSHSVQDGSRKPGSSSFERKATIFGSGAISKSLFAVKSISWRSKTAIGSTDQYGVFHSELGAWIHAISSLRSLLVLYWFACRQKQGYIWVVNYLSIRKIRLTSLQFIRALAISSLELAKSKYLHLVALHQVRVIIVADEDSATWISTHFISIRNSVNCQTLSWPIKALRLSVIASTEKFHFDVRVLSSAQDRCEFWVTIFLCWKTLLGGLFNWGIPQISKAPIFSYPWRSLQSRLRFHL